MGCVQYLAIALVLLFVGCTGSVTGEAVGQVKNEVNIGAVLSLTGAYASVGEDVRNGVSLAEKELNARDPSYRFNVIYDNDQSDTSAAVTIVRKYIDINNVNLIIGPTSSGAVLAVAPMTEEAKRLLFVFTSAEQVTSAGDFVFRNRETGKTHGERMAEVMIGNGIQKVGVYAAESPNSLTYSDAFTSAFVRNGGIIVYSATYKPEEKDFRTIILRGIDSGAQAFYIAGASGSDAGLLVRQVREQNEGIRIAGTTVFGLEEFRSAAMAASEGALYTYPILDENQKATLDFAQDYRTAYGKEPTYFAALGYDMMQLIANAVRSCGGDDASCVRDYLYSVSDYDGASGRTTFDENGDVLKDIALMTFRQGEPVIMI